MALIKTENTAASARGFGALPIVRQIALLVGLAASIALGVSVVLWSQTPTYRLLYASLADKDAAEVMDVLQKANIPFKLNQQNGAVMVAGDKVHEARLKLATQGLPKGNAVGFEIMEKERGFGTSQFMEVARYQRALEGELARTIITLNNVQSARVHLAIPKQSVFVRNRQRPSASVVIGLYPGRDLDRAQVGGITHLVAAGIPNLEPGQVTVIDQTGRPLNTRASDDPMGLSGGQFEYAQRVEAAYVKRIEELLNPVIGHGRVRAQVVVDLDFTVKEQTTESFDSEKPALRSEQTTQEQSVGYNGPAGIPGALSNQPPGEASASQQSATSGGKAASETPMNKTSRTTHNYELDKTISHTRMASGSMRRLSVAVVLDDKQTVDDAGDVIRQPYSSEEISRFTTLVKEAVGFDEKRGDSLSVINASFIQPEEPEPLPEPPLWEQAWVWDIGKQVVGGALVLLLVLGVLRPVLRSLAEKGGEAPVMFAGAEGGQLPPGEQQLSLTGGTAAQAPTADYESDLSTTRGLVAQDPKRVAQVVKTWVATDGG